MEDNIETNLENNKETETVVVELEKKSKGRKKSQYSESTWKSASIF